MAVELTQHLTKRVNRFLLRERYDPKDLFDEVASLSMALNKT